MAILVQPYTIVLLTTVIISAVLAVAVLKNRPTLGTHAFAVLMAAICMWALMIIFEVISDDPSAKVFSGDFRYLFIVIVPTAWFAFSLYYANRVQRLRLKHFVLLALMPAMTLVITFTNDAHHLMFKGILWHTVHGMVISSRQFGPWFWVHTAYSYALIMLGFLFLAKSVIDSRRIFRRQALSLLIASVTPWLCNVSFLSGAQPMPYIDLTPFAFTISGLAVMWGIMRYRLMDIVPIAHDIVIQNMGDGTIVMDQRYRILDVNVAACDLLGMSQDQLISREAGQAIAWWPYNCPAEQISQASLPAVIETHHGARPRHLQLFLSPILNKGKSVGHLLVLRDITAMKQTQDALRQSEERFKSLSENAPVIILLLDESATVTYVNPAWKKILGHEREEILGKPFSQFVAQDPATPADAMFAHLIYGRTHLVEKNLRFQHKKGGQKNFDFTASVNSDDEGRITGIICLAKDITEEGRLQEQLFQSQKMEAIGTLAGGIAHDFNNLLMGMQANVSLMRLETETVAPLQEKLTRIEDQIQTGASLTRQLLGYARKGKYVLAAIDMHHLIRETLHVVQRTNKNIVAQSEFNANPALIEGDKGQMELVLLNLLVNAVDAMPDGGTLTVATRLVDDPLQIAAHGSDLKAKRYLEIKVTDTGVGMDQGTMARIFEPFFTTKEIGRGTGLGLASVYGVVKNHHGEVRVFSKVGQGSTFVLMFPSTGVALPPTPVPEPAVDLAPNGRCIMLVDDEPLILEFIGEMIQSLGFKVIRADTGKAAVRIFEKEHAAIDLIILDMIMPEMDGREIFGLLKAVDPQVKVIIASGYGLNEQSQDILSQGPHKMLTKPFTREELARAIMKLLSPCEGAACAATLDAGLSG